MPLGDDGRPSLARRACMVSGYLMSNVLSLTGRTLLDRRHFLGHLGSGLAGVALASLLAEQGFSSEDPKPWRPEIRPETPLAARPPHFKAKAKRVLHVFCSGACSHLDTWDYKPELIKRH